MKKFRVGVTEYYYVVWLVKAESEEEAKQKACQGEGDFESDEYIETDKDTAEILAEEEDSP